ncbi:MAG: rRNA cytosine-C5-methylase [Alistipes sp.]
MIALPVEFKEQLRREMGGNEAEALSAALDGVAPVSVRLNPAKRCHAIGDKAVPWSRYGRYCDSRPRFTLDAAFHAGAYYVQEAGSQFVEYLLCGVKVEGSRILDMCAAPGGKTTIYSALAGRDGLVVANEYVRNRANVLADNVRKWGIGNVVVTNNDTQTLAGFGGWFDIVAVDAPCSGEGMFRKDEGARMEWSEAGVRMCAARQQTILRDAWQSLAVGGLLVYSTCTFNTTENEGVLSGFTEQFGDEIVAADDITVDDSWGIVVGRTGAFQTFRFMPHRTASEGFFAAVARKAFDASAPIVVPRPRKRMFAEVAASDGRELARWVREPRRMRFASAGDVLYGCAESRYDDIRLLAQTLTVIYSGVAMGQIFKGALKPDWALSQYIDLNREAVACTEVDETVALDYLRKRDVKAEAFVEGMNLVIHDGLPLGFLKRMGSRCNNLYPNSLRIMNM